MEENKMNNSAIRTAAIAMLAGSSLMAPCPALSQDPGVLRIGAMADQSGPYADNGGPGSAEAARMAIEDAGGQVLGKKIELLVADDQNKPDVGVAIARKWLDQDGVEAIVGGSASSIALGIQKLMAERKKPYMLAGTASSALTNDACSPYGTQWVLDTYSLPKATAKSLVAAGENTWFFITVDYTFGKQWQADTTKFIEDAGGKVVGSVLHPLNTSDFSSYLLTAQSSGAKVVALANSGADFANAIKQAQEFGLPEKQKIAPLGVLINQIDGIGLASAKGLEIVTPFYWDMNDETRAFATRFKKRFHDRAPNEAMAGTYSAVTHYLKAVAAAGTVDGEKVNAKMHEMPVNDFEMKNVAIRADGQVMRPMYTATIKGPDDSKFASDDYVITGSVPADQVWRPAAESKCPLLKP
jgi:branched-chain amino acid transport system substrate-binding protein